MFKRALCEAGKVGWVFDTVVVGEEGDFVLRSKGIHDFRERIVHLGHGVLGQALIDDEGD